MIFSRLQKTTALAVRLIEKPQSLRVLSAVRYLAEDNLNSNEYPSWVPTWNIEHFVNSFGVVRDAAMPCDAAAGFSGSWRLIWSGKILQVHGFIFDTIEEHTNNVEMIVKKLPMALSILRSGRSNLPWLSKAGP
jgi:hypothetical protein